MTGRRRSLAVALAVVAVAGCRVDADLAACTPADAAIESALEASLTTDEVLTDVFQMVSEDREGLVFVSGQSGVVDEGGEFEDSDGEILTWSFDGTTPSFLAVDRHARERSTLPPSEDDVRSDGAIESRACVAEA